MSTYLVGETISAEGALRLSEQFPIETNHHETLSEQGWTMLGVLQKAASEPCHRADYGWAGSCADIKDSGPDMHYACARCIARAFLKEHAENAQQQVAAAA